MGMAGFAVTLMVIALIIFPCVYGTDSSDHQEIKVQRLLKQLNKPALKSIKSEDGDIIDCVPIRSQPALDHPLLKNHTIQMRPSFIPESISMATKKKTKHITQTWNKNGECPRNTVAIKRIKKEDILRAKSVESFGKKPTFNISGQTNPSEGHEYAVMNSVIGQYFGSKFVISIWKPEVQVPNEFSLGQTWLVSGKGDARNTIEVGLQVYPQMYGDNNPRLFVFWTANGYQGPICYNTNCRPGFVQRSNTVTVGGAYTTFSQYDGDQSELSILVFKDGENWWLQVGEELVGYWPGTLFNNIGDGFSLVQWGGEIVNLNTDGKHTTTDMGSGHFAEEGLKKSSYFKNLMTVDGTNTLREPQGITPLVTNPNCYDIQAGDAGTSNGVYFFYGGPGQNENCP